ncbi:MAG: CHRD domain-containing protein [Anaerolineae bacterium]
MKKKLTFTILFVAILLLTTVASAAAGPKTAFRARLGGDALGSDAHGNAVFVFAADGSQMSYKLVVNGLDNTTMAHIHVAAVPGGDGPPVLWLYPDAPPPTLIPGTFNGLLGSRTVTPADLTGAAGVTSFEDLLTAIAEGRAYVNVHTTAFPGGEIRGTIR